MALTTVQAAELDTAISANIEKTTKPAAKLHNSLSININPYLPIYNSELIDRGRSAEEHQRKFDAPLWHNSFATMRLPIGWRSLLISGLLWNSSAAAKKDKPSVHTSSFPFWPYNVRYFDDSDVLLFEDGNDHVVFRSTDAGVSWDKVSSVPAGEEIEMIMHTYDNRRAYIITSGRSHWMTKDRGESWEEFYTDSLASVFREALTFHAKDPDRIIFNGMDCSGIFCEEIVRFIYNH